MVNEKVLDVLIIGAGFSGLHFLRKLRNNGFNVKIYEAGSSLGGTWYWNCYPGARVDSDFKIYKYTQDEVSLNFEFKERFPGFAEIQEYFKYIDKELNLSQDIQYNTRISSANFNQSRSQWFVKTETGETVWANHLLLCTGCLSKRYTPPFQGLDKFKGECYHTGNWPQGGVDLKEKRVAVIGTGPSGVQVIQEIGSEVSHLTVYQRTPNLAIPMQQYNSENLEKWEVPSAEEYKRIFSHARKTFAGFDFDFSLRCALDDTPEERRAFYEKLYSDGGFSFWLCTYQDILFSKEANDTAYQFWCEKARARINDPVKQDILAPKVPPHAFGIKRPCLEQRYFEVFNQSNVDIINVRSSPIVEITEKGIITEKEGLTEFDVIVIATGFDSMTGSILDINITNENGESLRDNWKEGVVTHLGMTVAGFPNMFFTYGPQAPTALSNGPSCIEIQGDWIIDLLTKMRDEKQVRVEAKKEAADKWKASVVSFWNAGLFTGAASWYQGANIPGRLVEPLNYAGGIPNYIIALENSANNNYDGFTLT